MPFSWINKLNHTITKPCSFSPICLLNVSILLEDDLSVFVVFFQIVCLCERVNKADPHLPSFFQIKQIVELTIRFWRLYNFKELLELVFEC